MEENLPKRHIGMVLPALAGGGAERMALTLARLLIEQGHRVDLVLLDLRGQYRATIPDGVRLFYRRRRRTDKQLLEYCRGRGIAVRSIPVNPFAVLPTWRYLRHNWPEVELRGSDIRTILGVTRYLQAVRPDILMSALAKPNNMSVLARDRANIRIPLVASIHSNVSMHNDYIGRGRTLAEILMPRVDAVVAVSRGVAGTIANELGVDPSKVHTIYNPVSIDDIRRQAKEDLSHPWFEKGQPPVILTVLREGPHKDWVTLIRAFANARGKTHTRLAILGREQSPEYWAGITSLAESLGVKSDVDHLGFDDNPFRYMQRANLFVLSSRYEGLGNVLVEALALGTPVVSTDTPYGPAEILEHGRYGKLTPIGDAEAMAQAILESLAGDTVPAKALRRRAEDFWAERAADAYQALFEKLISAQADADTIPRC